MFKIQEQLLTPNKYSRPGTKLDGVKGVVIHWTANENAGADADANIRFFENRKYGRTGYGSAHYFVDSEKIMRCLPESEMAYHVGATSYKTSRFGSYPNNCTLGVEMCVNSDGNFKVVYDQTVELTAMLMKKYKLNVDTELVRHFDVTGKNCPAMFTSNHWGKTNNSYATKYGVGSNADKAWENFKAAVKAKMSGKAEAPKTEAPKTPAPAQSALSHKVVKGDTLWGISRKYGVSVADIKKLNKLTSDVINPGDVLMLAAAYVVQKGDTLWGIARDHKMTVDELKKLNGLKSDVINPGDVLKVEGTVSAPAPKPTPKPAPKPQPKPAPKPKFPLPTGVYKRGDKGTAVKQIQTALNAAYFKCGTPDGLFGPATEDAVKRFQSVYANPADGIYGAKTREALNKKVN